MTRSGRTAASQSPHMAILRERVTWQRSRPVRTEARPDALTPDERANVRAALKFLRQRVGGWPALAKAMGIKNETLQQIAMRRSRGPTAGIALRAARVAGVCAEQVLRGAWPPEGACPVCGRC